MACIGKIGTNFRMPCGMPARSFNRIQGAFLINAEDIASYTVGTTNIATITMAPTKRGWSITTENNAFTLSVGIKSQDIMAGAYDVTATFKNFSDPGRLLSSPTPGGIVDGIARSELVIAVDHGDGIYRVYGLGAPLVCLEHSLDSTGDGYIVLTYGVEDWQTGTTIQAITKGAYDALGTPTPAPAPEP